MNSWKERLMEYLQSLDDSMLPEEVEKLFLTEWANIKEEFLQKQNETKIIPSADNYVQAEQSMTKEAKVIGVWGIR